MSRTSLSARFAQTCLSEKDKEGSISALRGVIPKRILKGAIAVLEQDQWNTLCNLAINYYISKYLGQWTIFFISHRF